MKHNNYTVSHNPPLFVIPVCDEGRSIQTFHHFPRDVKRRAALQALQSFGDFIFKCELLGDAKLPNTEVAWRFREAV